MNNYLALPLMQAGLSFGLLLLVAIKGPRHRSLRMLFLFFLGILGLWGVLVFAMRASADIDHALLWERQLVPLSILISVAFFHFVVRYTATRINKWLIAGFYLCVAVSIPVSATTDLLLQGMQIKSYGYAPIFGPLIPVAIGFSVSLVVTALVLLGKALRKSRDSESRTRALFIMVGAGVSLVGIAFDILPVLGLPLYPGFVIGNIIFCVLTSIAILKFRLLDIHLVLRKGVAYFLTTSSFLFVVMVIWALIIRSHDIFQPWASILIIGGLSLALPPLWYFFQRQVDRWFYRERYDHLKALELFGSETHSLADTETGVKIVSLLAQALRASDVHLFLPSHPDGDLHMRFTTARSPLPYITLQAHSPLVEWFALRGNLISREEFEVMPQFISTEREVLLQLGAELLAPVRTREGQLSGLILAGKKLADQRYNSEDKQLLQAFASQMATKLENIGLYADAVHMKHELQVLSRRLVAVQEEERRSIARELHDEIGQSLALTKILLDTAVASPKKAEASMAQAQTILKEVMRQVREISLNLRPSILDDLGLLPAMEWHLEQYKTRTGIRVDFEHDGLERKFPSDVSTAAYRIVQEGLNNIAKHAKTKKARLLVRGKAEGLYIALQDHGKGFNPHEVNSNSTGLMGMRERVTMLNGKIQIDSSPRKGTRLVIELPVLERRKAGGQDCSR